MFGWLGNIWARLAWAFYPLSVESWHLPGFNKQVYSTHNKKEGFSSEGQAALDFVVEITTLYEAGSGMISLNMDADIDADFSLKFRADDILQDLGKSLSIAVPSKKFNVVDLHLGNTSCRFKHIPNTKPGGGWFKQF